MKIGITMFATDLAMPPAELARAAEERGFDSLYVPEHTHIPVSRRTPAPTGEAELPEEYQRTLDPFVALSMAAAVTEHIRVGTGVCLVAQRDPIVTAKAVATLDRLSGGRFVFGVGYGWNREEMEDHGVDPSTRRERVREYLHAMRALWDAGEAGFDGEFVRVSPSWAWPKPVAPSGPPVLLGGAAGPTLFRHIADVADGWIPLGGSGLADAIPRLHAAAEDAGRDPASLRVVPFGTQPTAGKLDHYASLGIEEVVVAVPPAASAAVLAALDDLARWVGFAP